MNRLPVGLIDEIHQGNCVAFVGAGFSAPAIPHWGEMLLALAAVPEVDDVVRARVQRLVGQNRSKDFEAAAQAVRDALGPEAFAEALKNTVGDVSPGGRMGRRIELLSGIPFRAVLTTNFDGLMSGTGPGRDAYQRVLRPSGHRWWDSRYWNASPIGPEVVELHGSVERCDDIVFTRQDYRRRLYTTPGYVTFLRSVMATTTVLYLGFSFTDAYLDELRSEILALLEYRGGDVPIAYALLSDASDDEIEYARNHEGIEVIRYSSAADFTEFDELLAEIHSATNPALLLGQLVAGRRIVWIDPTPEANDFGLEFLEKAADSPEARATVGQFTDPESALQSIAMDGADLVVTHWGHGLAPGGNSTAEHVLSEVRRRDLRAPVVVFASGSHADDNKRASMALGATSYEFEWEGLFREIERIFTPGSGSNVRL